MSTLPYGMTRWSVRSHTLAEAAMHVRLATGDRDMWVVIARAEGTPWDKIAADLEMTRQGAALARKRGRTVLESALVMAQLDGSEYTGEQMTATRDARQRVRDYLAGLTDAELIIETPESLQDKGYTW